MSPESPNISSRPPLFVNITACSRWMVTTNLSSVFFPLQFRSSLRPGHGILCMVHMPFASRLKAAGGFPQSRGLQRFVFGIGAANILEYIGLYWKMAEWPWSGPAS